MEKLKKLFGGYHVTWKTVSLSAILAGVYTGLINQVPFLENTSFRDIAVSYEVWMLFAVLIAVNCEKPLESACKIFVFFLISQPLCFLVEVPWIGTSQASYYLGLWVKQILLTFPGGFVAFYIKKDNLLGALIAAAAAGFESFFLVAYTAKMLSSFPHHLLTVLFCIAVICCFIGILIQKKNLRILAVIIVAACIGACGYLLYNTVNQVSDLLPEGYTECTVSAADGSYVEIDPAGGTFTYNYHPALAGNNILTFTDSRGNKKIYTVTKQNGVVEIKAQ